MTPRRAHVPVAIIASAFLAAACSGSDGDAAGAPTPPAEDPTSAPDAASPADPGAEPPPALVPVVSGFARDPTAPEGGAGRGDRLQGVDVCIVGGDCTVTNENGRFTFEGTAAGTTVELTFDLEGYVGAMRAAKSALTVTPADAPLLPLGALTGVSDALLETGLVLVEVAELGLADVGVTPMADVAVAFPDGVVHYLGEGGFVEGLAATGPDGLALVAGLPEAPITIDPVDLAGTGCLLVQDNQPAESATITPANGRLLVVSVVCGANIMTGEQTP